MSNYRDTVASEGYTRANALRIRCRAFSKYPIATHLVHVDPDGTVRVWDSVACTFTTCHSMSESIRRKASTMAAL